MAKKNPRKNYHIFLVSFLFLVFSLILIFLLSQNFSYPILQKEVKQGLSNEPIGQINKTSVTVKLTPPVTPTATLTPTPLATPLTFGRQVRIPILTYHYIGENPNPQDIARNNLSVSPTDFDAQLEYIAKNGYTAIFMDTLYNYLKQGGGLPTKPVILTFDDGYIDFYINAYPIIKKHNIKVVSFIPTALMDQGYYLSWAQIKEMDGSGLISFQSHSVNHANLASLNYDQLMYQLTESKNVLQSQLGKPVNSIAYPYGISSPSVWETTKKAGYTGALGTWYGYISSEGTIYDLPRIKIPGGITVENFAKRL